MTRRPAAAARALSHLAAAVASTLLPAYAAHATTYSWSSPVSGTFTDNSLWSPNGLPNSGDTAFINADNAAHPTYTVSLFPNTPTGSVIVNADGAELDLRTVNGDTHTAIDSLNIQKGTLYFTNGNGTGLNHLDLGPAGLTLGQIAEADFGDGNLWQVHGNITNNGGNLGSSLFGGFHLSGSTAFTGIFNNAGAVTTSGISYLNQFTGSFYNLPNGTLTVQPNFHFRMVGGTFDFQGGTVTGTVEMYNGSTLKTSAATVQGNGALFTFTQPGYLATHLAPGTIVSVPTSLTTTNAATTNFGTIRLENGNGTIIPTLTLDTDGTGFLTNAPGAALVVNSTANLQGHLINRGLTLVNYYFNATNITNGNPADDTGVFYQTLGDTIVSSPAPGVQGQFNQIAGLLHVEPGFYNHVILDNSAFHYDGGTVEGAVQLRNNSHFTGNASDGHNATFSYTGPGTLGRVPEHTNILIDGQSVVAVGQDNYGTITLQSTNGRAADFTATDSVTFPNRGNLDLHFGAYVHGSIYSIGAVHFYGPGTFQNASLQNDYIFDVSASTQAAFTDSTLRHTGGPMTLANGSRLNLSHSTFSYEGGTIATTGTGSIHLANNSVLKTTIPNGNGAVFYLDRDNSIQSDLSPGVTVNAHDGTLLYYDGHTNRGTLNVSSPEGITTALNMWRPDSGTPTGTLTNNGAINFGPSSSPFVNGELVNNGSVSVKSTFNSAGQLTASTYVNWYNGNVTLNPGSTFTVDAYSNVYFHGNGAPNSATFTLNGGTLSLGKQSHVNMLDGASFVFIAGTASLDGATATVQPGPGGIPNSSLVQASGPGAALNLATAGNNVIVGGSIIGNDGASIITNDGGSLITNDGGSIIGNDGASIIGNDGASIIGNDGASIIGNDGASFVTNGGGSIIGNDGASIIGNDGASYIANAGNIISGNAGAIISGNGSAAPSGVVAFATTTTTPKRSTISLSNASLSAPHGVISIGSNATLTGHGSASATQFLSAGTLSPDSGTLIINAPATLSGGTLTGTGTLSFTQGLSVTAPVSKSSPGPLILAGTLSISPGASLDLSTAPLTLDPSTPLATIRQYLHDAQLLSSTPDPNDTHSLAYLTVGTNTLVQLTLTGDANVDGVLNADDFALLDKGFSTHAATWWNGDFNYDGTVTSADYLLLDSTYAKQQGGQLSPALLSQRQSQFGDAYVSALLTSVPEPTSLFAACGLALPLLTRRRTARALRPST